jgi:hypothetical protein
MVFAIAALLIQVTPAIQPVMPTASAVAANSSTTSDSTIVVKPTTENTATVRLNPEPVKVALSDSKQKSTYSINPVSLESTQNAKSFDTIRIPEANGIKPEGIRSAESYPSRKMWLTLAIVQHGAAFFDAYSTRRAISRGAVEDDPLMRPFAHSPALYGAIQVGPVLMDLLSHRMQRSENSFVRRMWWMPQSFGTGMYLPSAIHNMGVAKRMN